MKKTAISVSLIFVILLTGCPGSRNLKPVTFNTDVKCGGLQYLESGHMVFHDAESWEKFWGDYCRVITADGIQIPAPEVDFSSRMLIGVFSGEKPNGGYSITIHRVLEDNKKIVVEFEEASPDPGAMVPMVITYPCHIISIAHSDKSVEFTEINKEQ